MCCTLPSLSVIVSFMYGSDTSPSSGSRSAGAPSVMSTFVAPSRSGTCIRPHHMHGHVICMPTSDACPRYVHVHLMCACPRYVHAHARAPMQSLGDHYAVTRRMQSLGDHYAVTRHMQSLGNHYAVTRHTQSLGDRSSPSVSDLTYLRDLTHLRGLTHLRDLTDLHG